MTTFLVLIITLVATLLAVILGVRWDRIRSEGGGQSPWTTGLARALALPVGIGGVLVGGMSGFAWAFPDPTHWHAYSRLVILGLALVGFTTHVRLWASRHARQFPEAGTYDRSKQGLDLIGPAAAIARYRESLDALGVTNDHIIDMVDQLCAPWRYRSRAVEHLHVEQFTITKQYRIRFTPWFPMDPQIKRRFVLMARPEKGRVYDNLNSRGTDAGAIGKQRILSFIEAQAIVYAATSLAAKAINPTLRAVERREFAKMLLSPGPDQDRVNRSYKSIVGGEYDEVRATHLERTLHMLLKIASERRPMFIEMDINTNEASLEYNESIVAATSGDRKGEDSWRGLKARLRTVVGLPPTTIEVSLSRARTVASYQLFLSAPPGMIVAEVAAWDRNEEKWLPRLERDGFYRSYISWRRPRYQPTAHFASRSLDRTNIFPVFLVRLTEILPGTLGLAASGALAVLVAVWLTAVVAPDGVGNGTDFAAFALALPGVVSAFLGLGLSTVARGYRSFTGTISLYASAATSVLAISTYLARGSHRLPDFSLPEYHRTLVMHHKLIHVSAVRDVFLIQDWLWLSLFLLAFSNFAWATTTLATRLVRVRMSLRSNL